MSVQIEVGDEMVTAFLSGELDHHNVSGIREEIDNAVVQSNTKHLALDFRGVTFMDSSGIGLVMGRYKLLEEQGGAVELTNLPAPLKKVMRVAGMDKLVTFH